MDLVYCALTADVSTVIINPVPVIGNDALTPSVCTGTAFSYAPQNGVPSGNVVPVNTYTWSAPGGSGFTGGASGSGSSISGTLTNTTASPVTATYTIIPKYAGSPTPNCPGNPFTLSVTVNPKPVIPNQVASICSGGDIFSNTCNSTTRNDCSRRYNLYVECACTCCRHFRSARWYQPGCYKRYTYQY